MKTITSRIATAAAIVLLTGVIWFGINQYHCMRRNAEFSRRIKIVEEDAHKQLKVGLKKDDVARFYTEHKIPFEVVGAYAIGTIYTVGGCAPLGCGTDNALIGVRVKVDADGTVTQDPEVVNMYTNCL